jgi:hypothetical protein
MSALSRGALNLGVILPFFLSDLALASLDFCV